jgi:hypothetical protein
VADSLPLVSRVWFAWVCFFRVLFDPEFAWRALRVRDPDALPPTEPEEPAPSAEQQAADRRARELTRTTAALQLLGLLQREGRLVDFLQQDITSFDDVDVGAAARVVHEGCRKALAEHAKIAPVRAEDEGSRVTLSEVDPSAVKLTGNVTGTPPFHGVLRHRGWRAESLRLPEPVADHDLCVLAPAEVEL